MTEKNFPTVRRRLEQIQEYGLPHIVNRGNTLVNKPLEVIGYLESYIPEAIVSKDNFNFSLAGLDDEKVLRRAKEGLVKASLGAIEIKSLEEEGQLRVDSEMFELHAFYDTHADMTHYFLMPSRKTIEKKESR